MKQHFRNTTCLQQIFDRFSYFCQLSHIRSNRTNSFADPLEPESHSLLCFLNTYVGDEFWKMVFCFKNCSDLLQDKIWGWRPRVCKIFGITKVLITSRCNHNIFGYHFLVHEGCVILMFNVLQEPKSGNPKFYYCTDW